MVVRWSRKEPERVIGLLAGQIRDPVLRLRFLRRFAPRIHPRRNRRVSRLALQIVPSVLLATGGSYLLTRVTPHFDQQPPHAAVVSPARQPVFQVEQTIDAETWSNGLRIDNRFRAAGHARSYEAVPLAGGAPVRRSEPAGIVLHSIAPGSSECACNFVIDQAGRIFRIVSEAEAAYTAQDEAWSDGRWRYEHLNESSIGIAVERGSPPRASAMLIEMLRGRYGISAKNVIVR